MTNQEIRPRLQELEEIRKTIEVELRRIDGEEAILKVSTDLGDLDGMGCWRAHSSTLDCEQAGARECPKMPPPPFCPDAHISLHDLDILYYTLAMTYLEAAGKLTVDAVTDFIPGEVYTTCVRAGWVEDQGNPRGGVDLGEFTVTEEFKNAWMKQLEMSISDMMEIAVRYEDSDRRQAPPRNPKELIDQFKSCSDVGYWTDERIAEYIKCDPGTIVRLRSGARGRESTLTALADLMKREYPKEFSDLHWTHLKWPRQ
jgi:hypothetical protein